MKRLTLALIVLFAVLVACEYDTGSYEFNPDPDPVKPASVAPPDVNLVVNVDGEIRTFNALDPASYQVIPGNAVTDSPDSRVDVTADGRYVAYNSADESELVVYDTETESLATPASEITNEFLFVENGNLVFSTNGNIHDYELASGTSRRLVDASGFGCDHYPVFTPDTTRFAFKNHPPGSDPEVSYGTYGEPDGETYEKLFLLDEAVDIRLSDDLCINWLNTDTKTSAHHLILKHKPNITNEVVTFDFTAGDPDGVAFWTVRNEDGAMLYFTKMIASPDLSKLLFYGSKAVHILDVANAVFADGSVTATTVYEHDGFTTDHAAFTPDSRYFAVATNNWMGIYDAETLEKTSFDYSSVVGEESRTAGNTIYSLDVGIGN